MSEPRTTPQRADERRDSDVDGADVDGADVEGTVAGDAGVMQAGDAETITPGAEAAGTVPIDDRPPKKSGWVGPRDILRQVLCLDDTPHRIALGAAIGMAVGWTPTVGIQMIIVLIVAFVTRPFLRFNHFAGLVGVYVSNPITMVPMYWLMYWVGTFFVEGHASYEQFIALAGCSSFSELWVMLKALFVDIGLPLVIGSAILATVFGLITYPVMRYLLSPRRRPVLAEVDCDGPEIVKPIADTRAVKSNVVEDRTKVG